MLNLEDSGDFNFDDNGPVAGKHRRNQSRALSDPSPSPTAASTGATPAHGQGAFAGGSGNSAGLCGTGSRRSPTNALRVSTASTPAHGHAANPPLSTTHAAGGAGAGSESGSNGCSNLLSPSRARGGSKDVPNPSATTDEAAFLTIPMFDELDPKSLQVIRRVFTLKTFAAGDIVQPPRFPQPQEPSARASAGRTRSAGDDGSCDDGSYSDAESDADVDESAAVAGRKGSAGASDAAAGAGASEQDDEDRPVLYVIIRGRIGVNAFTRPTAAAVAAALSSGADAANDGFLAAQLAEGLAPLPPPRLTGDADAGRGTVAAAAGTAGKDKELDVAVETAAVRTRASKQQQEKDKEKEKEAKAAANSSAGAGAGAGAGKASEGGKECKDSDIELVPLGEIPSDTTIPFDGPTPLLSPSMAPAPAPAAATPATASGGAGVGGSSGGSGLKGIRTWPPVSFPPGWTEVNLCALVAGQFFGEPAPLAAVAAMTSTAATRSGATTPRSTTPRATSTSSDSEAAAAAAAAAAAETTPLDDGSAPIYARALEPTTVLCATRTALNIALLQHPKLRMALGIDLVNGLSVNVCLQKMPFFAALPEAKLALLGMLLTVRKVPKGGVLWREGQQSDGIYLVVTGLIECTAMGASGETVFLYAATPNTWVGESALLAGVPRTSTAVAVADTVTLYLSRSRFARFFKLAPELVNSMGGPSAGADGSVAPLDVDEAGPSGDYTLMTPRTGPRRSMITHAQSVSALHSPPPSGIDSLLHARNGSILKTIPLFDGLRRKTVGAHEVWDDRRLAQLGELLRWVTVRAGDVVLAPPGADGSVAATPAAEAAVQAAAVTAAAGTAAAAAVSAAEDVSGDGASMYIIIRGRCTVSTLDPTTGAEVACVERTRGDYFGEWVLLHRTRPDIAVRARTDCVLLRLRRGDFERFCKVCPNVGHVIQQRAEQRTATQLQQIPLFRDTVRENKPWSKMDTLAGLFVFEHIPAGTTVFRQGEPADKLYVVVSGSLRLQVLAPAPMGTGAAVVAAVAAGGVAASSSSAAKRGYVVQPLEVVGENATLGEAVVLAGSAHAVTAVAVTDALVLSLPRARVPKLTSVAPEMHDCLVRIARMRMPIYLRALPLFGAVIENKAWSKIDMLSSLFTLTEFAPGEVICRQGQPLR